MQYRINSVEDQQRNGYTTVEHTRLTYFTTGQRPVQLQLVRLVGSLALSFYCSLALSPVRCVVPLQSWLVIKIGIVINSSVRSTWRIIALSLAGVMENASCISAPPCYFSSSRLPRPLHQAATYYMTALRAALPDRPNSRSLPPPRSHYVSCGLKSTKCCQALHLSFRILQYILVKGLIDSVHWIEQPNAASTVFGHKNYAKVRLSHFSHFALRCTARRVQPEL